eukprot:4934142-Prymnesium_polylepis.2
MDFCGIGGNGSLVAGLIEAAQPTQVRRGGCAGHVKVEECNLTVEDMDPITAVLKRNKSVSLLRCRRVLPWRLPHLLYLCSIQHIQHGYTPVSPCITCVLLILSSIANNHLGAHYDGQQDSWVATPEVVTALAETFTKMPQLTSVK